MVMTFCSDPVTYQSLALILGCPKIVRADKGTENAKISFLHPFLRYQCTDGVDNLPENFLYGKSVNNQVSRCIGIPHWL